MRADSHKPIWPIFLSQIEEIVSAHLGPGRVSGNASVPCLSRQVSMYLAKHVSGWSLPKIGRFYNGRHHTTVLHAIAKVERLRKTDEAFDSLLDLLTDTLAATANNCGRANGAPSESVLTDVRSDFMQKWEYTTFNSQRAQRNDDVVENLNRYGVEGWELVSCTPVFETSLYRYVFKRPIR